MKDLRVSTGDLLVVNAAEETKPKSWNLHSRLGISDYRTSFTILNPG
jgi:hypothetical protein